MKSGPRTVWPDVETKSSPIYLTVAQIIAITVFTKKCHFQNIAKSCQTIGLLSLENLLPGYFKNSSIWSHYLQTWAFQIRLLKPRQERSKWAVVKWSACSPSSLMIRVRIQLRPTVYPIQSVFEINENKQIETGVGPFF